MRIALLTTDARGSLVDAGLPSPVFGTAPEALLQGFARLPSEAEVHVVSCRQIPESAVAKLAPNIFFHSLHVPKSGWLRTGYQGCIRAVRRKLKEIQPDIVHGQGTERDCAISAVFSGFPNVLTIHGNMRLIAQVNAAKPMTFQWLAAKLERFTIPRSDGVICITRYTQQAVADLARRTWILNNAVDESFFPIARKPTEPKIILCVGNISVRKNQVKFIEALDEVAKAGTFRVLFLGGASRNGDPYAERFFELVQARPWCAYGGMANREQLRNYFSEASLLALPSLEDNCPMTVLEAMAAGVPVAAARVGGVPELIEHERTGLMFDPLDSSMIAETVRRLMAESNLAMRLAQEARKEANARFHPQSVARRHLEIYAEVLPSSSAPMSGSSH